ncbi:MAG: TatD family hydrolase [Verrucomicrobiia bacterium]
MKYIEPHAHMVSRVTDDYLKMAASGCVAISEPAFWAGFDRCSADGFRDYFHQITTFEPARAAKYGIAHYCWLCINPKEAEDIKLAADVVSLIPEFLERPNALGIGEIGLNRNTKNELKVLEMHLELAAKYQTLVLVHTPHLEDKLKGTRLTIDAIKNQTKIKPQMVIIDHCEEHTVKLALDAGFWAGLTLYPQTKCTSARAIDIIEVYGIEKIWIDSACDWGNSVPLAIPYTALEMRRRGHSEETIDKLIFKNPYTFLSQSPKFKLNI